MIVKPDAPAFPDEANHPGIDTLTYIATQIAAAWRTQFGNQKVDSDMLALAALDDAEALIKEINKRHGEK